MSILVRKRLNEDGSECVAISRYIAVVSPDEPHSISVVNIRGFLVWLEIRRYDAVHAKIKGDKCDEWQVKVRVVVMNAQFALDVVCNNAIMCVYEELLECELFLLVCAWKSDSNNKAIKQATTCHVFVSSSVHRNCNPPWATHHQRVAVERSWSKQLCLKRSRVAQHTESLLSFIWGTVTPSSPLQRRDPHPLTMTLKSLLCVEER